MVAKTSESVFHVLNFKVLASSEEDPVVGVFYEVADQLGELDRMSLLYKLHYTLGDPLIFSKCS